MTRPQYGILLDLHLCLTRSGKLPLIFVTTIIIIKLHSKLVFFEDFEFIVASLKMFSSTAVKMSPSLAEAVYILHTLSKAPNR